MDKKDTYLLRQLQFSIRVDSRSFAFDFFTASYLKKSVSIRIYLWFSYPWAVSLWSPEVAMEER